MIAQAKSGIRRLLPKNHFARGVSVLVGGTAGSQVLLVLASPLLTRLYGPDDFGLLAVYASLLAIIGVVASLRYELAIPLPEDDVEAANVAALSLLLVLITAALTGVVVLLLSGPISAALGVPGLGPYLWLLPIGVLVAGAYKVFNYWAVRTKQFSTIASTKLRQAVVTIGIQLVGFKLSGFALVLGHSVGQGVGTTTLAFRAVKGSGFKGISLSKIKQMTGRYRRFPIFSTWEAAANTAGVQLPPLIFATAFTAGAAGLYALAHRVLTIPMTVVGRSVAQVFFASAAQAHRQNNLSGLVGRVHGRLAHVGMPPMLLLFLLGPDLFVFVFGEQWRQAGEFARWMAPWLYFQFVSSPISLVIPVTENQLQGMAFQIIMLIARLGGLLFGALCFGLEGAVIAFSLSSALCYLSMLLWIANIAGTKLTLILIPSVASLAFSLLACAPVIIGLMIGDTNQQLLIIEFLCTVTLISVRYWVILRRAYS